MIMVSSGTDTVIDQLDISKVSPTFARHETFHPRYGWLKKGFDAAIVDQEVFHREDAPVKLGVGKNMVRSIRYWAVAFKVLQDIRTKGISGSVASPTELGKALLSSDGWDPYLENLTSLWWLHWKLVGLPCYATSWYFAFNCFHKIEFTSENLMSGLSDFVDLQFPGNRVVEASLKKDVSCILRMYEGSSSSNSVESIGSPFADLGLIRASEDKQFSYFFVGRKPGLTPEIIVAACLEYASMVSPNSRTISASSLLYDPGSPGMIFKIDEQTMCAGIEAVAHSVKQVRLGETAGVLQLSYSDSPDKLSERLVATTLSGDTR